jgi:ubiquinone/menaquinone biosynthesis C-methylase UbiE
MFRFLGKIIDTFLKLLYGPLAMFYDIVAWVVSRGDWYRWVFQIENYLQENDKILEVGIGTGKLFNYLRESEYSVIGIDRSKQMLQITSSSKEINPKRLARADNLFLPFKSNSFDKLIASFPSEYVFINQFKQEAHRVLRVNGELIILMGVIFSDQGILNKIYQFVFQVSGQSKPKEKFEEALNSIFTGEKEKSIEWVNYKNVELCFIRIKN